MKPQRLTLAVLILTGINLVILVIALVFVLRPAVTPDVADVLRGRALEIVDSQGKVRAQILIQPASEQNGQQYAETVLFRLINPDGLPGLKIGSSSDSSGLLLARDAGNQQGWSGVQLLSEAPGGSIRLVGADGTEQVIQP